MVLLTEHDLIIRRSLVAWRGHEVKHTGDGIMAPSTRWRRAGVRLTIESGFRPRAAGAAPELRVRIGMAAGEPVDHNDDLFGSTVNLAAESAASRRGVDPHLGCRSRHGRKAWLRVR